MDKDKSDKAINAEKIKKIKVAKAQKKDPAVIEEERRKKEEKAKRKKKKPEQKDDSQIKVYATFDSAQYEDLSSANLEPEQNTEEIKQIPVEPAPKILPEYKKKKLLFLCTGNTCRSPMAEYIFKYTAKKYGRENEYEVSSAGISADGTDMSDNAKYALSYCGVPFETRLSTQMSVALAKESDLIICMTAAHKAAMGGLKNCVTLSELTFCGDIPDPYGQNKEAYVKTAQVLIKAIESLFT